VGTAENIPDIIQVDTTWPRSWVFFRTFVGAMLVFDTRRRIKVNMELPLKDDYSVFIKDLVM
jgi:hypothetical protein